MTFRRYIFILFIIGVIAVLAVAGCAGGNGSQGFELAEKAQKGALMKQKKKAYSREVAMDIYGYQPERALLIIDSAVIIGNMSELQADICRARIYGLTLMGEQLDSLLGGPEGVSLDSALAIGERVLRHDSVRANLERQKEVLEILASTSRMKNDTTGWLQRSRELAEVCYQLGGDAEVDALRTEAEIGVALCALGQQEQGMAKLDSVIEILQYPLEGTEKAFNRLDALIIALRRKIVLLAGNKLYAETLPLARRIIELLDDYEADPEAYHDGSQREPRNDEQRDDYIRFYRNKAQNYITAAYASLGESGNMLESFMLIEKSVREATAREHIARYRAMEHQMQRQAAESQNRLMTIIAIIAVCGLLLTLLLTYFIYTKNRIINEKNQGLIKLIDESIKYKELYEQLVHDRSADDDTTTSDTETKDPTHEELFQKLCDDIRELQLYLDPSFDRQAICERYHLTAVQVGNAFAQGSDYSSVSDFIRDCRLEYACQLLKTTDLKIGDVAARSGFTLVTTFNHDFKARYNLSPSEYRRRN